MADNKMSHENLQGSAQESHLQIGNFPPRRQSVAREFTQTTQDTEIIRGGQETGRIVIHQTEQKIVDTFGEPEERPIAQSTLDELRRIAETNAREEAAVRENATGVGQEALNKLQENPKISRRAFAGIVAGSLATVTGLFSRFGGNNSESSITHAGMSSSATNHDLEPASPSAVPATDENPSPEAEYMPLSEHPLNPRVDGLRLGFQLQNIEKFASENNHKVEVLIDHGDATVDYPDRTTTNDGKIIFSSNMDRDEAKDKYALPPDVIMSEDGQEFFLNVYPTQEMYLTTIYRDPSTNKIIRRENVPLDEIYPAEIYPSRAENSLQIVSEEQLSTASDQGSINTLYDFAQSLNLNGAKIKRVFVLNNPTNALVEFTDPDKSVGITIGTDQVKNPEYYKEDIAEIARKGADDILKRGIGGEAHNAIQTLEEHFRKIKDPMDRTQMRNNFQLPEIPSIFKFFAQYRDTEETPNGPIYDGNYQTKDDLFADMMVMCTTNYARLKGGLENGNSHGQKITLTEEEKEQAKEFLRDFVNILMDSNNSVNQHLTRLIPKADELKTLINYPES
jgi:hypothetical protein